MQSVITKKNRFTTKILVFVLLVVAGDLITGQVLRYLYFKQTSGQLFRTTYALDSTQASALIFGSSRANHHYHTEVLSDLLHKKVYNTGKDGNFILYNTAVLRSTTKRYTPEIIVLDFDIFSFNHSQENYDRLSALLPYYSSHEEIRDIVQLRGPFERVKLLSGTYPYNSMLLKILAGNTEINKTRKADQGGYVALGGEQLTAPEQYNGKETIDSVLVQYFDSFLSLARQKGSKVFVVASPVYYRYKSSESMNLAKAICAKHQVPFWDYSQDSTFGDNGSLFADRAHLNDKGARQFSALIAGRINEAGK